MTNYLKALTMELPALALVCGKSGGHHLEPDGLAAFDSRGSGDGQGAAGGADRIRGPGAKILSGRAGRS